MLTEDINDTMSGNLSWYSWWGNFKEMVHTWQNEGPSKMYFKSRSSPHWKDLQRCEKYACALYGQTDCILVSWPSEGLWSVELNLGLSSNLLQNYGWPLLNNIMNSLSYDINPRPHLLSISAQLTKYNHFKPITFGASMWFTFVH